MQLEVQTANRCHGQDQSGLPHMVPVVQQSLAPLAMSPHLEETHGNKRLEICLLSGDTMSQWMTEFTSPLKLFSLQKFQEIGRQ